MTGRVGRTNLPPPSGTLLFAYGQSEKSSLKSPSIGERQGPAPRGSPLVPLCRFGVGFSFARGIGLRLQRRAKLSEE